MVEWLDLPLVYGILPISNFLIPHCTLTVHCATLNTPYTIQYTSHYSNIPPFPTFRYTLLLLITPHFNTCNHTLLQEHYIHKHTYRPHPHSLSSTTRVYIRQVYALNDLLPIRFGDKHRIILKHAPVPSHTVRPCSAAHLHPSPPFLPFLPFNIDLHHS